MAKITIKETIQATVLYTGVFRFVGRDFLRNDTWLAVTDTTFPRHRLQIRLHRKESTPRVHPEGTTSLYRTFYKIHFCDHLHIYKNLTGFSKQ